MPRDPRQSEFKSPAGPATVSRVSTTPVDYVSPSTKRHFSHASTSAGSGITSSYLPSGTENDDETERKERRRSRVLELRRQVSSPASPSDRRKSLTPLNGLSNSQLTDHYADCIKLSAENKINSKNAFGLHLIDYMSDLLNKKEMTNFQVASSTLDASAKIYAGRVDAIHSETYKVLTGLGRSSEKTDTNVQDGEQADHEPDGEKKKKRTRRSNTIETNLKNINVNTMDLEFEVDPLFHKTSAVFDEGGTGGMLLNHLRCLDDTSALVLDSNTVVTGFEPSENTDPQKGPLRVDLKELKDMYNGHNFESLQICPEFADFKFMNWNKDEQALDSFFKERTGKSNYAFDLDAEPEAVISDQDPAFDQQGGNVSFGDDYHSDGEGLCEDSQPYQNVHIGDGKEARMVESTLDSIKHGTIGSLISVLASEPSEYSYFSADMLGTWAGPEHWKLKPKSKDISKSADDKNKKSKEKKEVFTIDYEEEVDFDSYLKETRAATTLTKTTLNKYNKSSTTLPEDLHYEADKLFRLFVKPKVMVKRQKTSRDTVDDNIEGYDYDNQNDKDNFCPAADMEEDDDGEPGLDFNFSNEDSHDIASQEGEGTLMGDSLVEQPRKVAKIDIAYAKAAKKVDVKKLKHSIWDILTTQDDNKENEEKGQGDAPKQETVQGTHSFKEMLEVLPEKVSKNMAKNLSVPMAFVCLLHLANEKTLKIESDTSMTDLKVSKG